MADINIKDVPARPERLTGGHRMCAGCGAPIAVRLVLAATNDPVVAACATGCLEVSTTIYPYTAWDIPFIHSAFENAGATIAGVEAAYRALKRAGRVKKNIKFVAFGGDGGTYDIGLQSLSGAVERGHDFVYVCYDNGAYMNTGIQRSGATPTGAWTTTSPVGSVQPGKLQRRKNLTEIMAAHGDVYVAQASVSYANDLLRKAKKAFDYEGPAFINVLAPCPRGWRHPNDDTVKIARLGVQTRYWPLYEVENGTYRMTVKVRRPKPLEEFLKPQGRFRHLLKPENQELLEQLKQYVDEDFEHLEKRCEDGE